MRYFQSAIAACCVFAIGCSDAASSAKKIAGKAEQAGKEALATAKKKFEEGRDALKKAADEHMTAYDKKLDELKAKAKDATGDAKVKLDEQVKNTESLMSQLKDHVAKAKDMSQDGWDAFKAKFDELVEQIKKSLG